MTHLRTIVAEALLSVLCNQVLYVAGCRSGWVTLGKSCYHFSVDSEPWHVAQVACGQFEALLAEIDDHNEDMFLQRWVDDLNSQYWIGGNDLENPGMWKWTGSDRDFSYVNWNPGEPNSWHGHSEHCVDMRPQNTGWNDEDCAVHLQYICEAPNGNVEPIG